MKEVFNLKDLIVNILKKWRWMLTFACVFAVLLGAYTYVSGMNELKNPTVSVKDNKEFEKEKKQLENEIDVLKKNIKSWSQYYTNSEVMKINALEADAYHVSFMVRTNQDVDQNGFLANDIAAAYANLIKSGKVYDDLGLNEEDTAMCMDLISATSEEGLVSVVAVIDKNEVTKDTLEKVFHEIQSGEITLEGFSDTYSVQLVSQNVSKLNNTEADAFLFKQEDLLACGDRYQSSLFAKNQALEKLKSENGYQEVTEATVKIDTVKYVVVGFVGGIIVGVLLALFFDLMSNKLRNKKEMETYLSLQCIGNPYMLTENQKRNIIDRGIDHLEGTPYQKCTMEEKVAYIVKHTDMLLSKQENINKILCTGTLSEKYSSELVEALKTEFKKMNCEVVFGEKITTKATSLSSIQECDAVIFIEKIGTSNWNDIQMEYDLVCEQDKPILGYLLV